MATQGNPTNIDILPVVQKETDEAERLLPVSRDLRNGVVSDAQNWTRRPGYYELLTLGDVPGEEPDTPPPTDDSAVAIPAIAFAAACVGPCPPDTIPTFTEFAYTECWNYTEGDPSDPFPSTGAHAGQAIACIKDGSFVATIAQQTSFSFYYNANTALAGPHTGYSPMFKVVLGEAGGAVTFIDPVPMPGAADFRMPTAPVAGWAFPIKSDVMSYCFSGQHYPAGAGTAWYYAWAFCNYEDQTVSMLHRGGNKNGHGNITKYGDYLFLAENINIEGVIKWQISTGLDNPVGTNLPLWEGRGPITPAGDRRYKWIQQVSDDFVWVMYYGGPNDYIVYKLDASDGSEIANYTLDFPGQLGAGSYSLVGFEVVSDDLFYFMAPSVVVTSVFDIYYFDVATETLGIAARTSIDTGCTPLTASYPTGNWLRFSEGNFYGTYGGFSLGYTNVAAWGTLLCPPDYVDPIGS